MATITQMPKPEAGQYRENRKLFLVPLFVQSPGMPEDGRKILEHYWAEVRDQLENLERRLGKITCVYHEAVCVADDEGMDLMEELNPLGSFVRALCRSDARLEATEDQALLEESGDWQRCISLGLMSDKVRAMAYEGLPFRREAAVRAHYRPHRHESGRERGGSPLHPAGPRRAVSDGRQGVLRLSPEP